MFSEEDVKGEDDSDKDFNTQTTVKHESSLLKKPVNKGKQMFSSSTGPVTRATTRSSKLKQCFLMTKAIILQNQKSYRKYSVFYLL
jgi:hypothetical protein